MREPTMNNIRKEEILKKCFKYLSECGLENVSMRNLCNEIDMSMSSVYYWFEDKDGVIINATEWGVKYVADELFNYIFKYLNNLQIIIITFSEYALRYQNELRFIYQVATSKTYGEKIIPLANNLSTIYDNYAEKIANHFGCNKQELVPYVYLFVSAVLDYVIWHDKNKMEIELNCIYSAITNMIK
jgi:AcrR family transcriptional regulator